MRSKMSGVLGVDGGINEVDVILLQSRLIARMTNSMLMYVVFYLRKFSYHRSKPRNSSLHIFL